MFLFSSPFSLSQHRDPREYLSQSLPGEGCRRAGHRVSDAPQSCLMREEGEEVKGSFGQTSSLSPSDPLRLSQTRAGQQGGKETRNLSWTFPKRAEAYGIHPGCH